jgi:hypothetical protein
MLLFKKKFLEAIREGRKTQTVRLWRACRFRTGQRSYIPGVGYIRITAIDAVRLEDLTDEDAVLDGFPSAAALMEEIRTLYADRLNQGYQAYRIRFQRVTETEHKKSDKTKAAPDPDAVARRASVAKPSEATKPRESQRLQIHRVRPLRNASSPQSPE